MKTSIQKVLNWAIALAGLISVPGLAADETGGFYVGVGTGMSYARDLDQVALKADSFLGTGSTGFAVDAKDINYKFFLGYQINEHIAVEFGYEKLGMYSSNAYGGTTDYNLGWQAYAFSVSGVGIYPINKSLSVFGRLGLANARVRASLPVGANAENVYSLVYGAGATYMVNRNLGLRLEWDRYVNIGTDDLMMRTGTGKSDVDSLTANAFFQF